MDRRNVLNATASGVAAAALGAYPISDAAASDSPSASDRLPAPNAIQERDMKVRILGTTVERVSLIGMDGYHLAATFQAICRGRSNERNDLGGETKSNQLGEIRGSHSHHSGRVRRLLRAIAYDDAFSIEPTCTHFLEEVAHRGRHRQRIVGRQY
jgi:hypothetical protein